MKAELKNSNGDVILNEEDEETYQLDEKALFENTSTRCPVVIIVDTSGSMGQGKRYGGVKPIDKVNEGLNKLYDYIKNDYTCSKRCEVAVIAFDSETRLVSDFAPIETKKPSELTAQGQTFMAPALQLMLDKVRSRKKELDNMGRSFYRPIVIFMTDGGASDVSEFNKMKEKIYEATCNKELTFNAIKVGYEENQDNHRRHFEMLQGFDKKIPASLLDVDKFQEFFVWLSRSVSVRSRSNDIDDTSFADPSAWWKGSIDD